MAQDINEVQRLFVQEAARVMIEDLIRVKAAADAFVADYDNQQTPITENAEVINDAVGGAGPRLDAPNITGNDILALRNFSSNISDQISSVAEQSLIELAVRPVDSIRRGI